MKKRFSFIVIGVIVLYNVWFANYTVEAAYAEHVMEQIKKAKDENKNEIDDERDSFTKAQLKKIDKDYEELTIELPTEKVEWTVDHEKGVGVEGHEMITFSTRSSIFHYEGNTSTTAVGDMSTVNSLQFSTSRFKYIFGEQVKHSFNVPGMTKTAVLSSTCNAMVPQGILSYGGYIFITAYCAEKKPHNSVIYVLNATTKQYLITLVTAGTSHAGGIEYANGYLWLVETGNNNTGRVECYNYTNINNVIKYAMTDVSVKSIDISNYCQKIITLKENDKASFISNYNGFLVIGEYNKGATEEEITDITDFTCELNFYVANDLLNDNNEPRYTIRIPECAQGITFYSANNTSYVLITTSSGVRVNSVVYVYKSSGSVGGQSLSLKLSRKIEMPCLVEESIIYGGYTYFIYESCGKIYREGTDNMKPAIHVVGKVCGFNNTFIYK